jgi:hypothetical protein
MSFHSTLTGLDIHSLVSHTFADASARTSFAYVAADAGKLVQQSNDSSFWLIQSVSGSVATFQGITSTDPAVVDTANHAYAIAIAGTNAAKAAMAVATAALTTSWVGTGAAHEANVNASGAYSLAIVGTNAAAAAQAQANQANAVATGAFTTAWTGTANGAAAMAVATDALSTAWVGTAAAAAAQAQANQANAVATDALTTAWTGTGNGAEARRFASGAYDLAVVGTNAASAAQAAANEALAELATVNDLLFHGQTGTFSTYIAQVPNWKSDLPVVIQNGVIATIGPSRYQYEDFKAAPVGLTGTALGDLSQGFTWNGSGMIQSPYNSYDTGVQPNDPISRLVMDEFSGQGTLGRHVLPLNTANVGSGWAAPWAVGDSWAFMGTELFEDYANVGTDSGASFGTFIPSSGTGGMGFTGTTFTGSFWYAP